MKVNKLSKIAWIISRKIYKSPTKHKHVAALIKNGKVMNIRTNMQDLHAETQVIKNKIEGDIVFVIRYENGYFKNSKPCIDCINALKKYNIKKIAFSTGDINNPFVIEGIYDIQTTWKSQFRRNFYK
jgi:hypothetical protein